VMALAGDAPPVDRGDAATRADGACALARADSEPDAGGDEMGEAAAAVPARAVAAPPTTARDETVRPRDSIAGRLPPAGPAGRLGAETRNDTDVTTAGLGSDADTADICSGGTGTMPPAPAAAPVPVPEAVPSPVPSSASP
jgi:hypothetical protein